MQPYRNTSSRAHCSAAPSPPAARHRPPHAIPDGGSEHRRPVTSSASPLGTSAAILSPGLGGGTAGRYPSCAAHTQPSDPAASDLSIPVPPREHRPATLTVLVFGTRAERKGDEHAHVADLHDARIRVRVVRSDRPEQQASLLQGVWHVSVAVRNWETGDTVRAVRALNSFTRDGSMSETASNILRGLSVGTWRRLQGNTYTSMFEFFRFNPGERSRRRRASRARSSCRKTGRSSPARGHSRTSTRKTVRVSIGCATEIAARAK
jgi:hypothetical protein